MTPDEMKRIVLETLLYLRDTQKLSPRQALSILAMTFITTGMNFGTSKTEVLDLIGLLWDTVITYEN
jgi:hypothetical protein